MAVQFYCVSCGKPIEIDDGWGGRLVECPYCHDTVTAPAFSPAGEARGPFPAATEAPLRPWSAEVPAGARGGPASAPAVGPAGPNGAGGSRLAVLALVLTGAALLLGMGAAVGMTIAAMNALGHEPTQAQIQAFYEQAASAGAPWLIKVVLASMGASCLWLAGVVCGIIAVCRRPRGVAIAALIVAGVPLLVLLLGFLQTI